MLTATATNMTLNIDLDAMNGEQLDAIGAVLHALVMASVFDDAGSLEGLTTLNIVIHALVYLRMLERHHGADACEHEAYARKLAECDRAYNQLPAYLQWRRHVDTRPSTARDTDVSFGVFDAAE